MAARISGDGRVTVSERRSIGVVIASLWSGGALIHRGLGIDRNQYACRPAGGG